MDDTVSTLPIWANTAVHVLVVLALAGLTFWLIATIVLKVLFAYKQSNQQPRPEGRGMLFW